MRTLTWGSAMSSRYQAGLRVAMTGRRAGLTTFSASVLVREREVGSLAWWREWVRLR